MTTRITDPAFLPVVAVVYADAIDADEAWIRSVEVEVRRGTAEFGVLDTTVVMHDGTTFLMHGRGTAGGLRDPGWSQALRDNFIVSIELGNPPLGGDMERGIPVAGRAMTRIFELMQQRDERRGDGMSMFPGRGSLHQGPRGVPVQPPAPEPTGPTTEELGRLQDAMVTLITDKNIQVRFEAGPFWQIVLRKGEILCGKTVFDVLITMNRASLAVQTQQQADHLRAQEGLRRGTGRRRLMVD